MDYGKEFNNVLNNDYVKRDLFRNLRESVSEIGASGFNLALTVATLMIAIAIVVTALSLRKNARVREAGKEKLVWLLLGFGTLFTIVSVINLIGALIENDTIPNL